MTARWAASKLICINVLYRLKVVDVENLEELEEVRLKLDNPVEAAVLEVEVGRRVAELAAAAAAVVAAAAVKEEQVQGESGGPYVVLVGLLQPPPA